MIVQMKGGTERLTAPGFQARVPLNSSMWADHSEFGIRWMEGRSTGLIRGSWVCRIQCSRMALTERSFAAEVLLAETEVASSSGVWIKRGSRWTTGQPPVVPCGCQLRSRSSRSSWKTYSVSMSRDRTVKFWTETHGLVYTTEMRHRVLN